jgi:hypothetical protein
MRLALALPLLIAATPALAQIPTGTLPAGEIPDGRLVPKAQPQTTSRARTARPDTPDRKTPRSTYGYRLSAPEEEDEDPTDRRVLRRLNTRLNNRLGTRIERYKSIDTKSDRTGLTTRNPYEPKPATDADRTDPILKKRPPDDPR